jgi:polysaccharide deacetylase 2 family uncharacterized protein YibQ
MKTLNRENKMRLFFGAGFLIFFLLLILTGVIFVRDMVGFKKDTPSLTEISEHQEFLSQETPESSDLPLPETPLSESSMPIGSGAVSPEVLPKPEYIKTLIIVIDDAGNNLQDLEPFLRFPGPLTIAVLPGLPYSAETARRIRAAGKEVMLHQPMEAIGGKNPGPGAVYSDMSSQEIRDIVERNLAEIGPAAGMNNHQGSKVTMNEAAIETVLTICREQGIYFLDSKTIADTVVPKVAERLDMNIAERDVFLDNIQEKSVMLQYFQEGLNKADRHGLSVMIGHTWSPDLAPLLTELYPDLTAQGYSFSTISSLSGLP